MTDRQRIEAVRAAVRQMSGVVFSTSASDEWVAGLSAGLRAVEDALDGDEVGEPRAFVADMIGDVPIRPGGHGQPDCIVRVRCPGSRLVRAQVGEHIATGSGDGEWATVLVYGSGSVSVWLADESVLKAPDCMGGNSRTTARPANDEATR